MLTKAPIADRLAISTHWGVSVARAVALQAELAPSVLPTRTVKPLRTVAGVDAAFRKDVVRAAVVVLVLPDLDILASETVEMEVTFPYLPGLLAFREGPAVIKALRRLKGLPDVLIFDGHGIAHPRRFGIASHVGVLLDTAAIGCAKTILSGRCLEPQTEKGACTFINDGEDIIGAAVRTRSGVKPVYVSIGHRMDLATGIRIILQCSPDFRICEPVRRAHQLCKF